MPSCVDADISLPPFMNYLLEDALYTATSADVTLDTTLAAQQSIWPLPFTTAEQSIDEASLMDLLDTNPSLNLPDFSEFQQIVPSASEVLDYSNNMVSMLRYCCSSAYNNVSFQNISDSPSFVFSDWESYSLSSQSYAHPAPPRPSPYQLSTYSSLAGWQS